MLFDHQTRIEMANAQIDRLHDDWGPATTPARHTLGTWLIRLGERLVSERRVLDGRVGKAATASSSASQATPRSALAHEALPRC